MKRNYLRLICCGIWCLLASTTTILAQNDSALERRAREVSAQFRSAPGEFDKIFAPGFLAQVPPAQLTQIFSQYFAQLGSVKEVKPTETTNINAGKFDLFFEKGFSVPVSLNVEDGAGLIVGLLIGNPTKLVSSLEGIAAELKSLGGETSLYVAKLESSGGAKPIFALNADKQMPLGSAFKLYILSELVRQINARERKWSDVVILRDQYKSLPSGIAQNWLSGTPVTLQTLATLMISISDNTAADTLLFELGREKIEKAVAASGHSQPNINSPFLSTGELFRLKSSGNQKLAEQFVALDAKAKREFLTDTIAKIKRDDVQFDGKPRFVDQIEWFASSKDVCNLLDSLRRSTESDKTGREIMAINPGLSIPRERWQFVGYKGGSETGVLNMSYLLQSTKGDWYAFSMSWKNAEKNLDEKQFFGLAQRMFGLIE